MSAESAAERMATALDHPSLRGGDLRFRGSGTLIPADYPTAGAFVIREPFRPSLASLQDMAVEHERTGERVVYDEARWAHDPRVEEQAGPSVLDLMELEARVR